MPSLLTEVGGTQPSTTSDPTKSPGAGQLGTTVVRERLVGRWERGRDGIIYGLGREGIWRDKGTKEWAHVNGQLAT